jgi:hypothetical protein
MIGHPGWCAFSQHTSRRVHYSITIAAGPVWAVLCQTGDKTPRLIMATVVDGRAHTVTMSIDEAAMLSAGLVEPARPHLNGSN